jgi:hypothetical protein
MILKRKQGSSLSAAPKHFTFSKVYSAEAARGGGAEQVGQPGCGKKVPSKTRVLGCVRCVTTSWVKLSFCIFSISLSCLYWAVCQIRIH